MDSSSLLTKTHYHLIGIGGIGMSALAFFLLEKGKKVSGSDLQCPAHLKAIEQRGAIIYKNHRSSHVKDAEVVVFSSSIKKDHLEYQEALKRNLWLVHRSEMLDAFMRLQKPLLIAGAHGKTSTSALVSFLLTEAGFDPSYAVGGIMKNTLKNAHLGCKDFFVAEVDESDGSFLRTAPFGAIVTNCDQEHMDFWNTKERLVAAYKQFIESAQNKKLVFVCQEDKEIRSIAPFAKTYGFSSDADIRIQAEDRFLQGSLFTLHSDSKIFGPFALPLHGRHQCLNTAAAIFLCLSIGAEEKKIQQGLLKYLGVKRRCDCLGTRQGITVYDDYAHHPTEVKATLKGLKQIIGQKKLVAVFQPHRYSRVKEHYKAFAESLYDADYTLLLEVYAAGENPIAGVSSHLILEHLPAQKGELLSKDSLISHLLKLVLPDHVVIFMGAGDVSSTSYDYFQRLCEL